MRGGHAGVAAARPVRGPSAASSAATGPRPGSIGVRVDVQPGAQHGGPLGGAGVRQQQLGIVAGHAVHGDHVDVQRARAPAHLADPAGGVLQPLPAAQPAPRVGVRVGHDRAPRSGSRAARPRPTAPSRTPGTPRPARRRSRRRRPAGAPNRSPRFEPEGEHRAGHRPPGSGRGPVQHHGDVGELQRDRGLRLVQRHLDRAHPPVGQHVVGDPAGHRLDQVARLAADDRRRPLGQRAVVEGVGQRRRRPPRRPGPATP